MLLANRDPYPNRVAEMSIQPPYLAGAGGGAISGALAGAPCGAAGAWQPWQPVVQEVVAQQLVWQLLWHLLLLHRAEAVSAITNTTAVNRQRDIRIRRIEIASNGERVEPRYLKKRTFGPTRTCVIITAAPPLFKAQDLFCRNWEE
jgi:hypothetical protein